MFANSRQVFSSQSLVHPRLRHVVAKHFATPYRRPVATTGDAAFACLLAEIEHNPRPLILDSGCGTGESTYGLARHWPDHWVIGIDKSTARLSQSRTTNPNTPKNALLLNCDLVDFWQLMEKAGLRCSRHYLYYPNPWPKPEHLMRRWHAHPVFPSVIALGGVLELRCNWRIYAEEFASALQCIDRLATIEALSGQPPVTPFERKYAASKHSLWRCIVNLEIP